MNINKQEMTLAYLHKDEPKYFNQFINYIDQIGTSCVKRLNVDPAYQEDVKQVAVEHAYQKINHYNPDCGSAAYSFFYKVILRRCLYELRDMSKKRNRMPNICSIDTVFTCDKKNEVFENQFAYDPSSQNSVVTINGIVYDKEYALTKTKEAKTIVRREKLVVRNSQLFSLKTNDFFTINDKFIFMVCVQILSNKEKKANRLQRSKG